MILKDYVVIWILKNIKYLYRYWKNLWKSIKIYYKILLYEVFNMNKIVKKLIFLMIILIIFIFMLIVCEKDE